MCTAGTQLCTQNLTLLLGDPSCFKVETANPFQFHDRLRQSGHLQSPSPQVPLDFKKYWYILHSTSRAIYPGKKHISAGVTVTSMSKLTVEL